MAAVVGALRAELSASIAKFQADMDKASQAVKRLGDQADAQSRRISKSNQAFTALGSTLRTVFSAAVLLGVARSMARFGDELQDTADQLQVTTTFLQGLQQIALDTGASTDNIAKALAILTDRLGDAEKGVGPLAKLMRELKIPLGTNEQVFYDLADAVKNASSWNEKMRITTAGLGDRQRALVPLLNQGADGIRRLIGELEQQGRIASPEKIAALDRASDAWERLINQFKVSLADPFTNVVSGLQKVTASWDAFWKANGVFLMWLAGMSPPGVSQRGIVAGNALGGLGGIGMGSGAGLSAPDAAAARTRLPPPAPGSENAAEAAAKRRLAWLAQTQEEAARDFEEAVKGLREAYVGQTQSLQNQLTTAQQIGDLQTRLGHGPFGESAERLRDLQKELDQARITSLVKIRELENERDEAAIAGNDERVAQLNAELSLQEQLHALVTSTSAEQLQTAERLTTAFKNLSEGLSSTLSDMLLEWKLDIDSLRSVFKQFINELLIKPAVSSATDFFSDLLKGAFQTAAASGGGGAEGMFQGGFATGGFVEPGHWAIAGEDGQPEAVFGGRTGAQVIPTPREESGRWGTNIYIDAKGADSVALRRVENTLRDMARSERKKFRIMYADLAGGLPR